MLPLVLALLLAPAAAQEAGPGTVYDVPRSPAAESYRESAQGRRIRTDVRALSADAPLDLAPPEPKRERRERGERSGAERAVGWLLLLVAAGLLIWALARSQFADLLRREPEGRARPQTVELADMGTAELDGPLDELAAVADPVEGLRRLLLRVLAAAAGANDVPLRRSFTARDVLARIPPAWNDRGTVERLVRRAELVVFGGRPFGRDDFLSVLEEARPLIAPRAQRRGWR